MQSRSGFKGKSGQHGNALFGAIVGISLMSAAIMTYMRFENAKREETAALEQGEQLAQFAVGLRGFVAYAQSNNALASGTKVGVDWLKAPSCGGLSSNPAAGFVPCVFTAGTVGPSISTTFDVVAATNSIQARATYLVPTLANSRRRSIFADRVAMAARGQSAAGNGTFFTVFSNVAENATSQTQVASQATGNLGRVILLVDNAPSNDQYLRTDGTNRMLANLNAGGFSIGNARDGSFSGNVRVQNQMQVDKGLTVVEGTADLKGGVVTPDAAVTDIGKYLSQGVYTAQVLTGAASYSVAKPRCNTNAPTSQIFASIQASGDMNYGGYRADAINQIRVDVTDSGGSWIVSPVMVGTKFDLSLNGSTITLNKNQTAINPWDARIVVMTKCS